MTPGGTESIPGRVRAAGVAVARVLEVARPFLPGEEPFETIVGSALALGPREALHLVVSVVPEPLFSVMRGLGIGAHTELDGHSVHVWFYRAAPLAIAAPALGRRHPPLQRPVPLDAGELEGSDLVLAVLERLAAMGPGAQLEVHARSEPALLHEKLALRGYVAHLRSRDAVDGCVIEVAPAWALGRQGRARRRKTGA